MARGKKTKALRKKQLDAQQRDLELKQLREAMQGKNFCKELKDEGDLWANAMVTVEPLHRRGEGLRLEDLLTPEETAQRLKRLNRLKLLAFGVPVRQPVIAGECNPYPPGKEA